MSAAEYYGSGPAPTRINTDIPPHPRPNSPSSPAPTQSTVSPISKPSHQPSFPPAGSGAVGYNDDFFGRHHSTQSIEADTSYHPPSHSPSMGPSHNNSFSNDYDKQQLYSDGIPLNDTRPQHPLSDAENGTLGGGGGGGGGAKKPKRKPAPYYVKKKPWFCWLVSTIQISVFIAEIVRNAILTGSPIAIKPQINPMIGPSVNVLINMGARFVPCMKTIEGITDQLDLKYPCPNSTSTSSLASSCSLGEWCGFGGNQIPTKYGGNANRDQPDQWWRFITPIFLHAGIIHISFNLLFQLRLGVDMEREIGPIRFALCYFSSGIFGFILGGNFAPNAIPSTGCSGSLFGIIALMLLDLFWHWNHHPSPVKELGFLLLDICIGFAIGLLPGLDNFSHIGGFLMGLILGIAVLHSPASLRRAGSLPYTPMTPAYMHGASTIGGTSAAPRQSRSVFTKSPAGFFKGRKPLWWAFWIARAATLATALIVMIVLTNNFYKYEKKCKWCRYLSCLPISNWCDIGGLTVQTDTSSNTSRMLARSLGAFLEF